jgi:L-alanine-DL-glutamate epimerase-like enolase superfamily enzyme
MEIKKIEIRVLDIKFSKKFEISTGVEKGTTILSKIYTNENITGVGDLRIIPPFQPESIWGVLGVIKNLYGKILLEKDPLNVSKLMFDLEKALPKNYYSKALLEMAIYDIIGKKFNTPIYNLLGGSFREKIPLKFPIGISKKEDMIKEAKELIDRFKINYIKLKVGPKKNQERDILHIKELRKEFGEKIKIQIDFNASYENTFEVLRFIEKIKKYNIIMIEQPLARDNFIGSAELVKKLNIPILADESVNSLSDAFIILTTKSFSIINIKIPKMGGLLTSKKIANLSEAAHLPIFVGSLVETGIGAMAYAHFSASVPNLWPAAAFMFGPYILEHHLLTENIFSRIKDGNFIVPKEKGLGIELDNELIERLTKKKLIISR